MVKIVQQTDRRYAFHCPACGYSHVFAEGIWSWNEDFEKPTISPSIRVQQPPSICHSFVREGKIEYCKDSTHELAGQTVDLPEI